MKITSMSFWLLQMVLFLEPLSAQPEPIAHRFIEVQPLWSHLVIDSNFVYDESDPFVTMHSQLDPDLVQISDTRVFLMSPNRTANQYVLESIDIQTGSSGWYHSTVDPQDTIAVQFSQLLLRNDREIELVGIHRLGQAFDSLSWNHSDYRSGLARTIHDIRDGAIVRQDLSLEPITLDPMPRHDFRIFASEKTYESAAFKLSSLGAGADRMVKYDLQVSTFNEELDVIKQDSAHIPFTDLDLFSIRQPNLIIQTADCQQASLAFKNKFDRDAEKGVIIMWTSSCEGSEDFIQQVLDITDIVPESVKPWATFNYGAMDRSVFIAHEHYSLENYVDQSYLIWLSNTGEVLWSSDDVKYDNHRYQYVNMIYAEDDRAYVTGYPSHKGTEGIDFLEVNRGDSVLKYVSSLSLDIGQRHMNRYIYDLSLDGYFVIGLEAVDDTRPNILSTQYHAFSTADLGLEFTVSTEDVARANSAFDVYPNPTSHIVHWNPMDQRRVSLVMLHDAQGKQVMLPSDAIEAQQIDLSSLAPGIYYLVLVDEDARFREVHKLVKMAE